jgi:hypothetical protein
MPYFDEEKFDMNRDEGAAYVRSAEELQKVLRQQANFHFLIARKNPVQTGKCQSKFQWLLYPGPMWSPSPLDGS